MHRRTALPLICALALVGLLACQADAARLMTWKGKDVSKSRFVDPAHAPPSSYNEPPGVAERPNALRANVFLPDGYQPERKQYPVLFLLHGQGDAFDSWANPENGDLLRIAADFPGIIVMPEGDRGFYANWWNGGRRGAPAWERYHLDQLIPLVERRLPIRRARRWHAVAGLSMGGEGAMFYASQRPGYFGSAASFSGPLSIRRPTYQSAFEAATGQDREDLFGDPGTQAFYWTGHDPKALASNLRRTRLYVAAGDGVPDPTRPDELTNNFGQLAEAELRMHAEEFIAAAENAGADVTYESHQGIHDWPYWRRDLANAIEWGFFGRVARSSRRWIYETVARTGEMWGLRFRFAEPPEELIRFQRVGRRLTGSGAGKVTLKVAPGCRLTKSLPFRTRLLADPGRC